MLYMHDACFDTKWKFQGIVIATGVEVDVFCYYACMILKAGDDLEFLPPGKIGGV